MVLPVLTHNGAYDDDYDLCVIKLIHLNSILNHFHVCILKYKQVICQKRKALSRDLSTGVLKKQEIKKKHVCFVHVHFINESNSRKVLKKLKHNEHICR